MSGGQEITCTELYMWFKASESPGTGLQCWKPGGSCNHANVLGMYSEIYAPIDFDEEEDIVEISTQRDLGKAGDADFRGHEKMGDQCDQLGVHYSDSGKKIW